jgi:regulator of PEP synthase PpsR (kinase-PPPase family)
VHWISESTQETLANYSAALRAAFPAGAAIAFRREFESRDKYADAQRDQDVGRVALGARDPQDLDSALRVGNALERIYS